MFLSAVGQGQPVWLINVALEIGHRQTEREKRCPHKALFFILKKDRMLICNEVSVKVNLKLDNLARSLVTRQSSSLLIEYDLNFAWKMSHKI